MSQKNKKKLEKSKERRKKFERLRNINRIERRKIRSQGMKIEYKRAEKVYCDECLHCKMNPKKVDCWYCGICDKERFDNGLIGGMGLFEANKDGNCMLFKKKKKGLLKRLFKL